MSHRFAGVVLFLSLSFATRGAFAQDDPLDIVVRTTLKTTAEHEAAYRQELGSLIETAMGDLSPRSYEADEQPKDGAAKYRLLVEHDGTITLGNSLSTSHGNPVLDVQNLANGIKVTKDNSRWESHWFLKVQERGRVTYTIQEWTGSAYRKLSAWSANFPTSPVLEAMGGKIEVASVVQSTDGKYDRNPPCPVTMAQAKEAALAKMLPSLQAMDATIGEQFMAGILEARIVSVTVDPDAKLGLGVGATGKCQIINRSPWPIKSATIVGYVAMKAVAAPGGLGGGIGPKTTGPIAHVFSTDCTFDKPLEPGKTETISAAGMLAIPLGIDARKLPATRIAALSFSLKP
ncbi:MAG: hypothetical protein WD768_11545 [Phycisphaeraceae bacterium]